MTPDPLPDQPHSVTAYTYDAKGRVSSTVDPAARVTWTAYDETGRVIARGEGPSLDEPPVPPDEPHIVE